MTKYVVLWLLSRCPGVVSEGTRNLNVSPGMRLANDGAASTATVVGMHSCIKSTTDSANSTFKSVL